MNSSFQPNVNPNIFLVQLNLDPNTFPSFQVPFCLSKSTCKNFAFIILFLHSTLLNGFTFITTYQDQILLGFQCSASPSLTCYAALFPMVFLALCWLTYSYFLYMASSVSPLCLVALECLSIFLFSSRCSTCLLKPDYLQSSFVSSELSEHIVLYTV